MPSSSSLRRRLHQLSPSITPPQRSMAVGDHTTPLLDSFKRGVWEWRTRRRKSCCWGIGVVGTRRVWVWIWFLPNQFSQQQPNSIPKPLLFPQTSETLSHTVAEEETLRLPMHHGGPDLIVDDGGDTTRSRGVPRSSSLRQCEEQTRRGRQCLSWFMSKGFVRVFFLYKKCLIYLCLVGFGVDNEFCSEKGEKLLPFCVWF